MQNSGTHRFSPYIIFLCLCGAIPIPQLSAQLATAVEESPTQPDLPVIPDEPKFIDEATFIHPKLVQKATVEFKDTRLSEFGTWLEETTGLPVIFDEVALSDDGRSVADIIDGKLNDEPIYLLLNRITQSDLRLAWYVDNDTLFITTELESTGALIQRPYSVQSLIEQGYSSDQLIKTIQQMTSGPWQEIDQDGGDLGILASTLFVRQTRTVQREVAVLLAALENHGAATFTLEPELHSLIRARLQENDTFDFQKIALKDVAAELSKRFNFEVEINEAELSDDGRTVLDEVSLSLKDRKLSHLLKLLFEPLALEAIPVNGRLLITTELEASGYLKTVVFDVRDLCRDAAETEALMVTIQEQTSGPWQQFDQDGGDIIAARPGTLVVRQDEENLAQVIDFLKQYRAVRTPDSIPEQPLGEEVITVYYKLDTQIAEHLQQQLPLLLHTTVTGVTSEDQQNLNNFPIVLIPSTPVLKAPTETGEIPKVKTETKKELVPQATLVISHRRKIHYQIQKIIRRIIKGDKVANTPSGLKIDSYDSKYSSGGFFFVPSNKAF